MLCPHVTHKFNTFEEKKIKTFQTDFIILKSNVRAVQYS